METPVACRACYGGKESYMPGNVCRKCAVEAPECANCAMAVSLYDEGADNWVRLCNKCYRERPDCKRGCGLKMDPRDVKPPYNKFCNQCFMNLPLCKCGVLIWEFKADGEWEEQCKWCNEGQGGEQGGEQGNGRDKVMK